MRAHCCRFDLHSRIALGVVYIENTVSLTLIIVGIQHARWLQLTLLNFSYFILLLG